MPKVVRVMDPEQSTDGGKRARQPITLTPTSGESASITIGWMDVAQQQAELRPYSVVAQQFSQRTGMRPDFDKAEYESLTTQIAAFLTQEGLKAEAKREVTMAGSATSDGMKAAGKAPQARLDLGVVFLSAAVGFAVGIGVGYLLFAT